VEQLIQIGAVPESVRDIGALAGLAAFVGLAILSMLYASQARDVRRLREWAGRAPERDAEDVEATSDLAAERAEELRKLEEERRQREQAVAVERSAAEKRQTRRQRREAGLPEQTRLERIRGRFAPGPGGRTMPEGRYIAVAVGAVIVLGVAGVVAASQLFSGGDESNGAKGAAVKPRQIEVAVLNGTNPPVNGLASAVSDRLESQGFRTGKVSNSQNSFTESVVMFKRGHKPEAAQVAKRLQINKVQLMSTDIAADSAGEDVSVVIGQDKADFGG
jgi:LytR cell envelope-related transcriptional attenuator